MVMKPQFFTEAKGKTYLPNVKRIFIPDKNMEIMDADLSGADSYTYFLDSNCKKGIEFLKNPKGKLAAWIASNHLGREITENDLEYRPYKASLHGWWYKMAVDKMAATIGCSRNKAAELDEFYNWFFPERNAWHRNLKDQVRKYGYISNSFGRRFWFLDTNDPTLENKIYATIPQSTTAEVINRGWINVKRNLKQVKVLLQVHDSLLLQYPIEKAEELRGKIIENMNIPLDYNPSVSIPVDYKISTVSYGDTKKPEQK